MRNILQGNYQGTLRIVNPKEDEVQGIKVFHDAKELPPTELAILVIPAKLCPESVELLASEKGTKAFIITEIIIVCLPNLSHRLIHKVLISSAVRELLPYSS